MNIIAAELRAELARRGWRHTDLANAAGISRSLVGMVCNGMRPSLRTREAILIALGPDGAKRVTRSHAGGLGGEHG